MMVRIGVRASMALLILGAACSSSTGPGPVCTLVAAPALAVTPVDSISGAPVPDPLIWVREGDFVDTLQVFMGTGSGPYERKGTYDVFVEASGYDQWFEAGVTVMADECHVLTRSITARMRPVG